MTHGSPPRPRQATSKKADETYFIGRYRVIDELGVGGMATVHLASMDGDGGFQKWVAIKRVHPHLVESEHFVKMFLDEARIAASISHPNVAQVFDLGSHENTHWIAMEYLHGEPLREVLGWVIDHRTSVDPGLAARMISDAAEGLHAAHELRGKTGNLLNLVHRDVSPHNLFVTYDGVVKVVDFGIAKVAGGLSTTQVGTVKGKITYMSPEQVRGHKVDRRTDIFALGVVLWELTTGRRLFRADSDMETLERVRACLVPPPSTVRPTLEDGSSFPIELESIIMKALNPERGRRFQTARALSKALQQFLLHLGQFIGPEDVSVYMHRLFSKHIVEREQQLEMAAEVTRTVSGEDVRAAIRNAGYNIEQLRKDVGITDAVPDDTYDDDEDDGGETIVEPFREVLAREGMDPSSLGRGSDRIRSVASAPRRAAIARPGPGSAVPSPAQFQKRKSLVPPPPGMAPKPQPTPRQEPPSTSKTDPFDNLEDLTEDPEENIPTAVLDAQTNAASMFKYGKKPSPPTVSSTGASGEYASQPPAPPPPPAAKLNVTGSALEPAQPPPPPAPAFPAQVPGFIPPGANGAPPPGPPTPRDAPPRPFSAGPLPPIPQYAPVASTRELNAAMHIDPNADDEQWARGLRGSPILVYAAAAVGGFLIVAVLIAVLLGGPDNQGVEMPSPEDLPPAPPASASR